ncbi:MAG: hypothetical protein QM676_11120 [Novosphingobium sp.]
MSLVLRWRAPERRIVLRWRGPAGMAAALERGAVLPVAAVIGPPGPPGPAALPVRIEASLAATWTLPHALGRMPTVQVFLTGGEAVLADVTADHEQITVAFSSPRQGFVLAF